MIQKGRGNLQKRYGKRPATNSHSSGQKTTPKRLGIPRCYLTPVKRGPIISLVGPPGAGKSEIIRSLSGFAAYRIDDYRDRGLDNRTAWECLLADVMADPACVIVESSGLSVRVNDLRSLAEAQSRRFYTVIVMADVETCIGRSGTKRTNKLADVSFTMDQMVTDCVRYLPNKYENALLIDGEPALPVVIAEAQRVLRKLFTSL